MMTLTVMTLLTLAVTFAIVPRIYWPFIMSEHSCLEPEIIRNLQEQREWVLRHLRFSLTGLVLLWVSRVSFEVPYSIAAAIGIYAASALLFVVLDSLLAQKLEGILAVRRALD